MLALSRKKKETIVVGEGANAIVVKVLRTGKTTVTIGVEAPKGVLILRGEKVKGVASGDEK